MGKIGTVRASAPEASKQPVTVAELRDATAAMKLWKLQTQTRRAEETARKAGIRGKALASACSSASSVLSAWVGCK